MSDKDLKYKNKDLNLKNQTGGSIVTKFLPEYFLKFFIKDTLNYDKINDTEVLQIAELMKIQLVTTLNITNSDFSTDGFKALCDALKTNTLLQTLNLTNCIFNNNGFDPLYDALKTNTTLQILNFTNSMLTDYQANEIIRLLKINKTISNIIIDDKFMYISQYRDYKYEIELLKFQNFFNTIDNKTLKEITNFLNLNKYTILNIKNIKISDIGFTKLCDALKTNTTLTTLHIDNINLDNINLDDINSMVVYLFTALKENKTLTTLHLNINNLMIKYNKK